MRRYCAPGVKAGEDLPPAGSQITSPALIAREPSGVFIWAGVMATSSDRVAAGGGAL